MFILYSFILQFKLFNTLFDWRWGAWLGWLAPMLAWDALGLDWWVMQALGTSQGFALRHNFWLESGLHVGVQRVGAGRLGYGLARIGGYALPPQPKV